MRLVYDGAEAIVAWAQDIVGVTFRPDARAIGVERNGVLVAAAVFDTMSTTDCFMHAASDGWWVPRRPLQIFVPVFAYPFVQLRLPRVSCLISEDNHRALRLAGRLGFREEGRMREAGSDGEDMVLFGMLRRECRWLKPETSGVVGTRGGLVT